MSDFLKNMFFLTNQRAEKYIIIVEAKDRGEEIQLSSSCTVIINIEDGNNHLPEIIGQTVRKYFFQLPQGRQRQLLPIQHSV